jgi:hypothetical protein
MGLASLIQLELIFDFFSQLFVIRGTGEITFSKSMLSLTTESIFGIVFNE